MNDFGYVEFIKPKEFILNKWIKGYYVHCSREVDFHTKLTFYQNITTTISIYKDSETTSKGRSRLQKHKANSGFSVLLAGLVDKYQQVEFLGPLDRMAVVFYPGGINHFMRKPLGNYLQRHYSFFNYFENDFETLLPTIFATDAIELKRDLLDEFFISKFIKLPEPKLYKAITLLTEGEEIPRVSEVARQVDVSRRTLLRKFKLHLGYSVEDYISVVRFRRALLNFQKYGGSENISRIAYESSYYDQADFNHALKSKSGLTPTELFRALEIVDDTLFWKS